MSFRLMTVGVMVVGGATIWAVDSIDTAMNYSDGKASISSVTTDCFIKGSHRELDEKKSNLLAYMDCSKASFAAAQFGFSPSDIHQRSKVELRYVSPVDNSSQVAEFTANDPTPGKYKPGADMDIKLHTSDPKSYKFR